MARKLRLQYPGAIYHVMSRGDHLEPVFLEEADQRLFVSTLGESGGKTDWQIHAYCLMRTHFHLVVETPKALKGSIPCIATWWLTECMGRGTFLA